MKIAYLMQEGVPDIFETPLSGPAIHVKQIFTELRNRGHHVRLLVSIDHRILKSDDLENYSDVDVHWLNHGFIHLCEKGIRRFQYALRLPYFALFNGVRFAEACRKELAGFDVFYERMGWMGYGASLASQTMHIPLVIEVNGDHLSELKMLGMEPRGAQRWFSIQLMRWAILHASHSVTTGEGWRTSHIARWGAIPSRVSVVENGTELVKLLTRDQLSCFCDEDTTTAITRLVYLGAIEPWSGLKILISVFGKILHQGLNLQLVIAGNGSLKKEIEYQIHELGIESCVTIMGSVSSVQVAKILADSDIGLSPYCGRVEFSGLKLFDYKAAGLATIASGRNGQPAVIKQGITGLIVSPCNEKELFEAIVQLSSDIPLRRQMGREARLEAETQHCWSQSAIELEKIFRQATGIQFPV